VLALSRWQGADIRGLVDEELAPYRTGDTSKIVTSGPNVSLQPAAAQSLALALHELATNAAKYGALSSMSGRVQVTWELSAGALVLRWAEAGGPPTQSPASPGFGTRIITASIEGQLAGKASFDWQREGLQCVLSVPRDDSILGNGMGGRHARDGQAVALPREIRLTGNRIMVVEDEALVAMSLCQSLDELGFEVIGPFSRIADAIVALKNHRVDAAVLDVNLGGELVYPLAEALVADQVPFIFVTGYGTDEIEQRFARTPVLQKPIERDALRSILARQPVVSAPLEAPPEQRRLAN
jgi:CheY-like chemotaxis protein